MSDDELSVVGPCGAPPQTEPLRLLESLFPGVRNHHCSSLEAVSRHPMGLQMRLPFLFPSSTVGEKKKKKRIN